MHRMVDMKKQHKSRRDKHKPSRQVRIRLAFISVLEQLADRNASSVPEEVNRAVRELLAREGLWPSTAARN